jgi:putative ABC transport system ATP-binding protein
VAIARAIVSDPSYVLADEPTAALDGENGQAIMGVLAGIAKDPGRGVLVVTHDSRLTSFADRTIDIEDGRLVDDRRNGTSSPAPATVTGG